MTQKHPDVKAKDLLVPVKYRSGLCLGFDALSDGLVLWCL